MTKQTLIKGVAMGNIEEKNMTWTETPAEAFRKKLIADAEKSAKISKMIIKDCERRQKEHDEWLIKKGMEENE